MSFFAEAEKHLAVYPRKFKFVPPLPVSRQRVLILTEFKLDVAPGCVVVKPGECFEMNRQQFDMLFMQSVGPLYDPKHFEDMGPVVAEPVAVSKKKG